MGILVDDPKVVEGLEAVFQSDWEQKAPPSSTAPTVLPPSAARVSASLPLAESGFVLISRSDSLRRHPLPSGTTTIGRADDNEIVIPDTRVSRYHAKIEIDGARYTVADIDSANGTFVNGKRIVGTRALVPGDVVGVADGEEFRFVQV